MRNLYALLGAAALLMFMVGAAVFETKLFADYVDKHIADAESRSAYFSKKNGFMAFSCPAGQSFVIESTEKLYNYMVRCEASK